MNRIQLLGKISKLGRLRYAPSGTPVLEFTIAVPQVHFESRSVGYIEALLSGERAEEMVRRLRIGKLFKVEGSLWSRVFRDRQGRQVQETKVLVEIIEEEK